MNLMGSFSLVALLSIALPNWGQGAIGPCIIAQAVLTMALLAAALATQARPSASTAQTA